MSTATFNNIHEANEALELRELIIGQFVKVNGTEYRVSMGVDRPALRRIAVEATVPAGLQMDRVFKSSHNSRKRSMSVR